MAELINSILPFALKQFEFNREMIVQAETAEQIEQARLLFREYEAWLGIDLCFQNFETEVATLPGKYAAPSGRLLLILIDEKVAGCIALRKIDDRICEMKRLYVRDEFRGTGAGRRLIEKLLEQAQEIGYERMRLDTLAEKMPKAVELYKSHGFRRIAAYYHNPYNDTLFMEKSFGSKK